MRAPAVVGAAGVVVAVLAACEGHRVTVGTETLLGRWHLVSTDGYALPTNFVDYYNDSLGVCSTYLDSLWYEFAESTVAMAWYHRDECAGLWPGGAVRLLHSDTTSYAYVRAGDTLRMAAIGDSTVYTMLTALSGSTLTLSLLAGDSVQHVSVFRR